jgi:hypothetical protein
MHPRKFGQYRRWLVVHQDFTGVGINDGPNLGAIGGNAWSR